MNCKWVPEIRRSGKRTKDSFGRRELPAQVLPEARS
jgi:hypothetical protein